MNLNELFFFKVFPCIKDSNNKLNPGSHNEKNCYFYHELINYENGKKIIIEKDRRREVISLTDFFKKLNNEFRENENFNISMDTIFELKKNDKYLNYYIDCLPFKLFNEQIFFDSDYCKNEIEFNYHINRYKKNICPTFKILGKCKKKFCYNKHISNAKIKEIEINKDDEKSNEINNIDIDEEINKFKKKIEEWKDKKEIQLKEIISIYKNILSIENRYLSKIQIDKDIKQNFIPFDKWYDDYNNSCENDIGNNSQKNLINSINNNNISNYIDEENISNERIIQDIYKKLSPHNTHFKISKNRDLFDVLKELNISSNVCYLSKYNSIKLSEVIKYTYAMLNSCEGLVIYGCDEENRTIKGISLSRKERDDFKKWFNSEFFKLLIKYEENIKYKFYDLLNNNNDECILIIEIKKLKMNKLLKTFSSQQCFIINENFLNEQKGKKYPILKENDVIDLNTKEYVDLLRKRLLYYYSKKMGIKINIDN